MSISYIYSGEPLTGTSGDDFVTAISGFTAGTDDNTINANEGDDLVIGDSTNFYTLSAGFTNDSIANAFSLDDTADVWTTSENEMFGDWHIPHATVIAEATVGQAEYYSVAVGAGPPGLEGISRAEADVCEPDQLLLPGVHAGARLVALLRVSACQA